ncbi:acyltransferase family protein [Candidatus Pelagibacter sp.]|nr:acyltransferase family protein [Candidatus Pelagibacter sp.]
MTLKYRPEIDGLRAISVFSVLIYHYSKVSNLELFELKGGFLGVDIFFVISGYLITLIILDELRKKNNFSLKNFYERRMRRIIPALFFLILITLPFSWFYLLPTNLVDFTLSILSIFSFNSNIFFWYTQTQYAADAAILKPLLHTWSLAVEEQYYILMPIILIVLFRYFNKHLFFFFITSFFFSLFVANYLAYNNPNINFYNLVSRAFELLSGSILAYIKLYFPNNFFQKRTASWFSFFGLCIILLSLFFFNEEMHLPSFYTLVPVSGACVLIYFSGNKCLVTKVLSNKFIVFVGLISYSLYLWHFPIFSFVKIMDINTSIFVNGAAIWLTLIILSIGSYYFIEKPFRNKKNISFKKLCFFIFSIASIIISYSIIVIKNDGFMNRVPELFHKKLIYERERFQNVEKCLNRFEKESGCELNLQSSKSIFLIGDSHMADLYNSGLKEILLNQNYRIYTFACFVFPNFSLVHNKTNKVYEKCSSKNFKLIEEKIKNSPESRVIFFGRLPLYLSGENFDNLEGGVENNTKKSEFIFKTNVKNLTLQDSFKDFMIELKKKSKIIFIYPYPEAGWEVPEKILSILPKKTSDIKEFLVPKNFVTTSYDVFINRTKSSFELLDSIIGENIYRIYPHEFLCNTIIKDRCINHDSTNIYYRDDNHPTKEGAKVINDMIVNKLLEIEYNK